MNSTMLRVTNRIIERSRDTRAAYLARINQAKTDTVHRAQLACGNLAHGFAACQADDKASLKSMLRNNIAIITSYNDMLSAHQPYEHYPEIIRKALHSANAVGQVAGGVPAMCDGVTQGQDGMELSLLSREVIAMSAAIGLSHNMFDGALYLGVCDKIVPGLTMAALSFGHLPSVFIPSGPMASGLPNKEKVRIRQLYAEGKVDRMALLESEAASYHAPGTCTFYGTANTNQMVVEFMGMQLPGSSFVHPDAPLREALTAAAARQVTRMTGNGNEWMPLGKMFDEKVVVNGIVALLATGGSTNHTMHLVAMARAAGIIINWDDFSDLSDVVPLLARLYPNGPADINHFQAAGGVPVLVRELLKGGLLHEDVHTVAGFGLSRYTLEPWLNNGEAAGRHDHLVQKVLRLKPVTGTSRDRADHLHVAATEPEGLERLVDQAVHPLNEPGHAGHERFALDVALGEGGAPFFFEDVEEVGGSGGRGFSQRFHRRAVLLSKRKYLDVEILEVENKTEAETIQAGRSRGRVFTEGADDEEGVEERPGSRFPVGRGICGRAVESGSKQTDWYVDEA